MLTVSNTSPISNLASISRLQFLKSQFETVWIPDAVSRELLEHPDPEARQSIQNAMRDGWTPLYCASFLSNSIGEKRKQLLLPWM